MRLAYTSSESGSTITHHHHRRPAVAGAVTTANDTDTETDTNNDTHTHKSSYEKRPRGMLEIDADALEVRASQVAGGGLGVYATRDLAAGE